jgi:putative ABC transport system ATP-binding protein
MSEKNIITLKDISKSFPLGETMVTALKKINLTINAGDFTALVGSSGSGKSTLMNLIGCIDEPDSGDIIIQNQNILKLNEHEKDILRNEKIGFVFQSFNLIPVMSVFENVELPLLVQSKEDQLQRKKLVEEVLNQVDLLKFKDSQPAKLSGGQRQRVAIARALVNFPEIILADEPTANLDSHTAHSIIDLMANLNKEYKKTFLFSTHDEKLIHRVEKVIHIKDGYLFS